MLTRRLVAVFLITLLLAGCGGGPVKRINPSAVSIQQLHVEADGHWRVTLRIHNFSTVPMHYSALNATLTVDGKEITTIDMNPDIRITGDSGDVVDTRLAVSAKVPSGNFAYTLKGTITTDEPGADFEFDRDSRLSPVPGVANTWR